MNHFKKEGSIINKHYQKLLSGGGEMGERIREKDWSTTEVGNIETWPQSLYTTLSIILNSKFPMFLWWGPELICFYNDAYRPSLGEEGKHPSILGQRAKDAWPEIWDTIKPLIDQVVETDESIWREDKLIPIYRNGKLENVYWTFSYSPVKDESAKTAGVLVTCHETTQKIKVLEEIKEREAQLKFTINAAGVGTWDLNLITGKFSINTRLKKWLGFSPDSQISLSEMLSRIAESDRDKITNSIETILKQGTAGNYEVEYSVINPINKKERRLLAKGKALFNAHGSVHRFSGIVQDITEQVSARNKIEESEKRFRKVADSAPVLIWISGTDKLCYYFNIAWLEFTGKTMEQEKDNGWIEGVHPEDLERCLNTYTNSFDKQEEFYMEYRLRRHDGEYRWISDNGVPRFTTDGIFEGYIGACMDIHENIVYQKKVEDAETRMQLATEATELATWELDLNTRNIIYSPRLAEILGHSKSTVLTHQEMRNQLCPEDVFIVETAFENAFNTGIYSYEARIKRPNDDVRWIRTQGRVFYDENNKPNKLLGTLRDITEEKAQRQELYESEQKFRLLADSMPQHVWTTDPNGQFNYYNQSVFDYTGLNRKEINKDGWIQILHPDDREKSIQAWKYSIMTGKDFLFEHRFRRYDGEYHWQLSRAIPQKDAEGNIQMWVGTSTDIQEQKTFSSQLEKKVKERTGELAKKNKELEKMNVELESFAYVSSHDLQEPLRKIQIFAVRILEKEYESLSSVGKDYFERMRSAAERMQVLIEDLLTYSRTNTMDSVFVKTDLLEIISEVKNELKEVISEKQATIEVGPMREIPVIPFQFRQLLLNLINNSIKFSKPDNDPYIKINSEIVKGNGIPVLTTNKTYCHLSVSDNGIGFDPKYKDQIFEVFQRLHGRDNYKGTGIGLAIVKKIIENHDGFITATGKVSQGATFNIYLPVNQVKK